MPLTPLSDALDMILSRATAINAESVALPQALMRVLAEDIAADRDYPPFNRSAMDGYAIRQEDWASGKRTYNLVGSLHAGATGERSYSEGDTLKIMTGAPVPAGLDAVIRREDATDENGQVVFSEKEIKAWKNIARQGEDVRKGDPILEKGTLIMPHVIAALAVTGHAEVKVARLPKVAILGTGNEVKPLGQPIEPHQIRDSNSYALQAFFQQYGITPAMRELVVDDKDALRKAFTRAMEADIIVSSGAVSAGDADFIPGVLNDLGVTKAFHKTQIKPGKPVWFGHKEHRAFFALPGNPMSVQVGFKVFIEPFLRRVLGMPERRTMMLPFAGSHNKRSPFDEFFPVRVVQKGAELFVEQLDYNGSGDITAMIGSDGLAVHPAGSHELTKGERVSLIPWNIFA